MRRGAALLLLLAGCAAGPAPGPGPASAPPQQRTGASFLPDAQGLAVISPARATRIDFGRTPAGVKAALTRETGAAPLALPLTGCPPGITEHLRWGDLALTFDAERFLGWRRGAETAGRACPASRA